MSKRYSWTTYLKHAFSNWYNYISIGLVVGLALIFKQEGLLYLGAAAELAYLYMCVSNPRYLRYVDSLIGAERELDIEPLRDRLWPMIEEDLQQRYGKLAELANKIEGDTISTLQKRDPFYQENKRKIAVLLASYLKIAFAVTRYKEYLAEVDPDEIQLDIERLEEEVLDAPERIQQVKKKNIEVLTKRLDKVKKARANSDYLSAQMETIEDTMKLVVDQAITLSDPKGMGMQIDNLLLNLQETELVAAEMESFVELEQGLSDEVISLPERE
jgi:hypothetical protein